MNPRLIAAALLGLTGLSALPARAQAQDPCTQMMIYAIQQFCSVMPNGQSLCQPVALTGPSPACELPAPPQFKPVPLAAPSLQFPMPNALPNPMMAPMAGPGATPFLVPAPFPPLAAPAPSPYVASPISPFAAQPLSPFAPQPLAARPGVPFPAVPLPAAPLQAHVAPPAPNPGPQAVAAPVVPTPAPAPAALPQPPAAAPQVAEAAATPALPAVEPPATPAPAAESHSPAPQAARDDTAPEPVATNLPEAPSLPAVVAEAVALFPFDSAELTPLGTETLDSWLASAPVGMPVVVYGYADRLGPESYNQGLSQRRADAARTYLISKGKDGRDIRAQGKGEANPVKHCKGGPTQTTIDCLAPNRRVHIIPE